MKPAAGLDSAMNRALNLAEMFRQFKLLFPNEEACWIELIRLVKEYGIFRCRNCRFSSFEHLGGRRVYCLHCNISTSITVGTLFERIRRAEPWLAAVWLMERGVALTSSAFHSLVDVTQSSALIMLRKIRVVLESSFDETAKLIPSGQFKRLMCRRSLETPARLHPSAEDDDSCRGGANDGVDSRNSSARSGFQNNVPASSAKDSEECADFDKTNIDDLIESPKIARELEALPVAMRAMAKSVLQHLATQPLSYDELFSLLAIDPGPLNSILTILELAGLVQTVGVNRFSLAQTLTGSGASFVNKGCSGARSGVGESAKAGSAAEIVGRGRAKHEALILSTDLTVVKAVSVFIARIFSGVSRKYLQLYLVALWCCVDLEFWGRDKIFKCCYLSPPLPYHDCLAYVSAQWLKLKGC